MINPLAVIPPACAAQYQGEEWKCIWSSYRLPMLKTDFFLNAAQFDAYQLMCAPALSVPVINKRAYG